MGVPFAELVFGDDSHARQAYIFLRPTLRLSDTVKLSPKEIGHRIADIGDRLKEEGTFPGKNYKHEVSLEIADSIKCWREALTEVTSKGFFEKATRAAEQAEAGYGFLKTWGPRLAALRWLFCMCWIAARATVVNFNSRGGSFGTIDPKRSAASLRQTKERIFKWLMDLCHEAPLLKVFDFDLIGFGVYINGGAEKLPRGGDNEWFRRQMELDLASMCRQALELPPLELNIAEPILPILRPYGEATWELPPPKALRCIIERHNWFCKVRATMREDEEKKETPAEASKRRALARMELNRSGAAFQDLKAGLKHNNANVAKHERAEFEAQQQEKAVLQGHLDKILDEQMEQQDIVALAKQASEQVKLPQTRSPPAKSFVQGALLIMEKAPPPPIDLQDPEVIAKIQRGEDLGKGSQEDGLPGAIHGSIGLLFAGMCAMEKLDNIQFGPGLLEIDNFLEVFLEYSTSLKTLVFSGTKGVFSEEHLRVLPLAGASLQTLDLTSCGLDEKFVLALADAFEALPGLKHVDLGDNKLEKPAALGLLTELAHRRVDLTSLRLDGNPIGDGEFFSQDVAALLATRGDQVVAGGELVLHQDCDAVLWYPKPREGTLAARRRDDTKMLAATSLEELELGASARNQQLDLIVKQGVDLRTTNDVGRELLRKERLVNENVLEHPMVELYHESVIGGEPGDLQPPDRTLPPLPGGVESRPASPLSPGGREPLSPGGRAETPTSPPLSPLSPKSPWGPGSPSERRAARRAKTPDSSGRPPTANTASSASQ